MRLHRFLSQCGVASRRKSEEIIAEGRVQVNGEIITEMGTKIDPAKDVVTVDEQPIEAEDRAVYMLYKPLGIITTMSDDRGRRTVKDLMPEGAKTAKPVGRLDRDSDGLLLLTNHGDLAARLTHPRYKVEKEYQVTVAGELTEKDYKRLTNGIVIEGKKTLPAIVRPNRYNAKKNETSFTIILKEGRKRQIRLMCEAVAHPVVTLRRVRIGNLLLKGMSSGQCIRLGKKEVNQLLRSVDLPEI